MSVMADISKIRASNSVVSVLSLLKVDHNLYGGGGGGGGGEDS